MSAARYFPLVLLAVLAASTSACAPRLPRSAEPLLLQRLQAQKILKVHEVRRRTIDGFDYLGVFGTFEITWGFESWYHPQVILRKRHSDADWSRAELFWGAGRIESLFTLSDAEFTKALRPWSREKT
jgi:hypothetical protein